MTQRKGKKASQRPPARRKSAENSTVCLVSLGCVRNLVDSELILGRLASEGFVLTDDPSQAESIIVNTCGFIQSAVDESIDTILDLARYKKKGPCRRLVVCGCMAQRYGAELKKALPEADAVVGPGAHGQIPALLRKPPLHACMVPDPSLAPLQGAQDPRVGSTPHMAYIKVSEGCPDRCTYCMIPALRGAWRSRPLADVVKEAENLIAWGAREIILVAQDATAYGQDLDGENRTALAALLESLCRLEGDARYRFLYGHPNRIDDRLLEVVAAHDRICSYFDLPIQHASDPILKKMGRRCTGESMFRLFETIRAAVPGAALRSTALVGFPGETDQDFAVLKDFVQAVGFDHLGVFTYSDAEEIASHHLPDHVPEETAEERRAELMGLQGSISLDKNAARVGKSYTALVTDAGPDPDGPLEGRTCFQAPDVDGVTFIQGGDCAPGDFVQVRVVRAEAYDLWAEPE